MQRTAKRSIGFFKNWDAIKNKSAAGFGNKTVWYFFYVHSVFGIQVCMEMLSIYETKGTAPALVLTMILIGMIYGGYYLVSQFGCEKIVRE